MCDDGEGFQVGLPHVASNGGGIFLKVLQKVCSSAISPLDVVPVLFIAGVQDGTACLHNVLEHAKHTYY